MTTNLYPTFDVPGPLDSQTETRKAVGSWHFNVMEGEFLTDGGNKVQRADEWTAWAQWCMKVVKIERFAHLAYSGQIGIETDEIRNQPTRPAAESLLEKNVTEALMVHPNTKSVREFEYAWDGDHLKAIFKVYPTSGTPITISTTVIL